MDDFSLFLAHVHAQGFELAGHGGHLVHDVFGLDPQIVDVLLLVLRTRVRVVAGLCRHRALLESRDTTVKRVGVLSREAHVVCLHELDHLPIDHLFDLCCGWLWRICVWLRSLHS